jgi:hypothetical protein
VVKERGVKRTLKGGEEEERKRLGKEGRWDDKAGIIVGHGGEEGKGRGKLISLRCGK